VTETDRERGRLRASEADDVMPKAHFESHAHGKLSRLFRCCLFFAFTLPEFSRHFYANV